MHLNPLQLFDALKYGTLGLCGVLAFLAFLLLHRELAQRDPRPAVLRTVWIFMAFALISMVVGLTSQLPMFRNSSLEAKKNFGPVAPTPAPSDLQPSYFGTTWTLEHSSTDNDFVNDYGKFKARYKYTGTLTGSMDGGDVILQGDLATFYLSGGFRGSAYFYARGPLSNHQVAAHFTYTREGVNGFGTAFIEFDDSGHGTLYEIVRVTNPGKQEGDVASVTMHITRAGTSK